MDRSSWMYIDWVQFVLKIYEILHFVRGLYDKLYCFTSDVMYKKYKRLVYTPPDLLARFCKVNLSKAKNSPDLFPNNLFSRPNLLLSRATKPLPIVLGNYWATFCGSSTLEQIFCLSDQLLSKGLEHISSTKKSILFIIIIIIFNFLKSFFLTEVSNYCELLCLSFFLRAAL